MLPNEKKEEKNVLVRANDTTSCDPPACYNEIQIGARKKNDIK